VHAFSATTHVAQGPVAAHAGGAGREEPTPKEGTCRAGARTRDSGLREGEPVGWCQYGPREELSRIDNKWNYRELSLGAGTENLWRISCFVTDKKHRRRGVASAALAAALESIRRKGGGVVEAYPMIPWEELCRARVRRCGHAPAFGNASTHGTLSMFERQGFKVVGPYGLSNVVVRKTVVGSKGRGTKVRSDNGHA
jgi:GNAT superfamily N-acetyltransferase